MVNFALSLEYQSLVGGGMANAIFYNVWVR
jgi:hypothetical protein